ncbi:hypothetical protein ACLOJK_014404 [Asimina triloba]
MCMDLCAPPKHRTDHDPPQPTLPFHDCPSATIRGRSESSINADTVNNGGQKNPSSPIRTVMSDLTSSSLTILEVSNSLLDQSVRSAIKHRLFYRFMAAYHSRRNQCHYCRIPTIDQ